MAKLFARRAKVLITALFLAVFLYSANSANATRGCCSWHGGVSYCDSSVGRYVCNDGTYSPSCGCAYAPPKPICVKPNLGKNANWNFSTNGCNQDITISWDKGSLDDFYSIQVSKSPGADPGPISDTSTTSFTFKDVKPGKWYVNVKPGRSCGWGDIAYWTVDVPEVVPEIKFKEKIISEDERQLDYSVSCGDKIDIIPEIGSLTENSGSIVIHPKENIDYTITASNNGESQSASLSVKYPLPKKDDFDKDVEKTPSNQDESSGAFGWSMFLVLLVGFVWFMDRKNKS